MITLRSYIAGKWVEGSGDRATLVNPATEEAIAVAGTGGIDLSSSLDFARQQGGPALRALSFAERGEMLKALSRSLHEIREPLIEASILNGGTTRSDAKFDIDGATGTLAYYASLGKKLGSARFLVEGEGEQLSRSPRFWGRHVKVPRRGVAVHINAFNFPAWGLAEKAAVALLAGVPVITKPATSTALLAYRVMERIVESRILPEGALQFIAGSTGDLLEHLGPQDLIAFTGSADTAALLRSLSGVVNRSVRMNVEADSLNAAVLGADVEPGSDTWSMFLRDVAREMTQKTGQKCTATRRILIPAQRVDEVRSELSERLADITIGDPSLDGVRMGPLATAQQLKDVRSGLGRLVESGAKIVFGDSPAKPLGVPEGKGYFVGPVLLEAADPAKAAAVHSHEVFGPVATLLPYREVDEAVDLVAMGQGGLVAEVYSDDRAFLEEMVLGVAPFHGRVFIGSEKVVEQATAPGVVLPSCVHGGPGRAGGGEELGGERGLDFYLQRTAIQGDRAVIERMLRVEGAE